VTDRDLVEKKLAFIETCVRLAFVAAIRRTLPPA
jgi:hypothetical protein